MTTDMIMRVNVRTTTTTTFGVTPLLLPRVVFSVDCVQLSLSIFRRVSQVPFDLWVQSGGGAVVVRGYSGYIPGFPVIFICHLTVERTLLASSIWGNIYILYMSSSPI